MKGAGKSTLSSAIVDAFPSFTRLSIDTIIADRHGIYNVDYPPSKYPAHQEEARQVFSEQVHQFLREKKNMVLDRSFYAKKDRDEYKAAVEYGGGQSVLVYLKAGRDVLWKRICERRAKDVNADSAFEINPALLDQYVRGFEVPDGEGEIVISIK